MREGVLARIRCASCQRALLGGVAGMACTLTWIGCGTPTDVRGGVKAADAGNSVDGATSMPRDAASDSRDGATSTPDAASDSTTDGATSTPDAASDSTTDGATSTPGDAASDSTAANLTFDLGLDFSFALNPNGVWRYGYTAGADLADASVLLDTFSVYGDAAPEGFWHPTDAGGAYTPNANPTDGGGGYYPYVAENPSSTTAIYQSSWALRSGEVAIEGSNAGQYGIVQFVAPQTGTYQLSVHFEGIHFRLSTTDVHVYQNAGEIFASNIDGYGGDPSAHAIQGTNPSADYQGTLGLQANDVLTFAVGFGTDGTNFNDTTGLFVHLTLAGQ